MPRRKKPTEAEVNQAANAINAIEMSLTSAMGNALILQTLADKYDIDARVPQLAAALVRGQKAAERTHVLGAMELDDLGVMPPTGPVIQSGGGPKDPPNP